jgi:hypothetical protein
MRAGCEVPFKSLLIIHSDKLQGFELKGLGGLGSFWDEFVFCVFVSLL